MPGAHSSSNNHVLETLSLLNRQGLGVTHLSFDFKTSTGFHAPWMHPDSKLPYQVSNSDNVLQKYVQF